MHSLRAISLQVKSLLIFSHTILQRMSVEQGFEQCFLQDIIVHTVQKYPQKSLMGVVCYPSEMKTEVKSV